MESIKIKKKNLTLIGMAGVGKSFIGNMLAETLNWKLIDIDKVMEKKFGKPLQNILDEIGDNEFKKFESTTVIETCQGLDHSIISPGGSIVYSKDAVKILRSISTVFYLHADPIKIEKRIHASSRGIVGLREKSFTDLYLEREKMYKNSADLIINTEQKKPEVIINEILTSMKIN